MKIVNTICPNCGASIQVDADKKNLTCNYCGNNLYLDDEVQHVQYDNAEETGYQFEKGRQRAQAEARQFTVQQQYNSTIQQKPKRKTWLWVLGWIFIFPVPLTILLLRKKEMNPVLKYGIIAVAWIFYLIIVFSGGSSDKSTENASSAGTTEKNETEVAVANNSNIKELSFIRDNDRTVKVGQSTPESYLNVKLKDKKDFSPSDVIFVSENPEIATIEFTKDALTTCLYFKITGVSPGETYVYANSQDGSVVSDKIKVIVEGDANSIEVENDTANDTESQKTKLSLSDITYVELNELQKLFIDLPTFADRDEVNNYTKEHGFSIHWFGGYHYNASSCYIGMNASAVSDRPRDREGEVIDLHFNNDGTLSQIGYALGGSVSFFENFDLTYTGGTFHYDGEDFDDGEAAMQLYLANNGASGEAVSDNGSPDEISMFIEGINASGAVNLEFVEDFVPSDKESGHYKTEFRLNAYKDAIGKSYKYEDTTVDIIMSSRGVIERIYMDGATYEQCENMIRYASPLLDSTATDDDIQETVDYISEYKSANGYYYAKLGLLMLGGGDKGYEFMLKLS